MGADRQQQLTSSTAVPIPNRWLGLLCVLALLPREARAESWYPSAFDQAAAPARVSGESSLQVNFSPGFVPHFRTAPVNRLGAGLALSGWLGDRVRLSGEWQWLVDASAAGDVNSGPGDVRLGSALRVWTTGPLRTGLGWEAKLPNAANEDQLGTDETDISFGAWARVEAGPWRGGLAIGLGVLGNPLRYANQDDVPLAAADVGIVGGGWQIAALGSAEFPTARNPARAEVGGRVRYGGRWFVEGEGAVGVTPAAPDGRVLLRFGVAGSLPDAGIRE